MQFTNNNKLNKDIIDKEIKYALEKIKINPINECPFCYIRGLINKFGFKFNTFILLKMNWKKLLKKMKIIPMD